MRITPVGDCALRIELGEEIGEKSLHRVQAACAALAKSPVPGLRELVPAYTTITAHYDPLEAVQAGAPEEDVVGWLTQRVSVELKGASRSASMKGRTVEIPVCYGGDFGPDLARVAKQAKLSPEEVVKRHAAAKYLVHLVGFAPGFPYLGGMPKELATPRLAQPRARVPAGAVGIAGAQTGVYPLSTPGGWNLIGRTPLSLFSPENDPPALLAPGDAVKFRSITAEEFQRLEVQS